MSNAVEWLVCFAVAEEAASFVGPRHGQVARVITGMGRRNAERSVFEALKKFQPDWVISAGFAGGLNPELKRGLVLFDRKHDSPQAAELAALGALPATFHSTQRVAVTAAEKRLLRRETGADAVEMESSAIRELCHAAGFPVMTIRVISDTADEDLPLDFNALMTPADQINWWKFARTIAFQPTLIGSLIAFQRQTRDAARQLGRVLNQVVKQRAPAAWRQGVP